MLCDPGILSPQRFSKKCSQLIHGANNSKSDRATQFLNFVTCFTPATSQSIRTESHENLLCCIRSFLQAFLAGAVQVWRCNFDFFFGGFASFFPKQCVALRGRYKGWVGCSLWPGGFVCAGMPFWDSMLISTAQARPKFAPRKAQFRRHRFTGCLRTFSDMNFFFCMACARNRARCGNRCKRSISWTLPNVGRRVSFEGLRFTWQAQGIRTMEPMFWGWRAQFLRGNAFLELELEDALAAFRMTSANDFEVQPSAEIARVDRTECW